MRNRAITIATTAALFGAVLTACTGNGDEDNNEKCGSTLTSGTAGSPEAGILSVNGTIENNEDVFAKYSNATGSHLVTGITGPNNTIRFPGIPAGSYSFEFLVSCDAANGQESHGNQTVTIK